MDSNNRTIDISNSHVIISLPASQQRVCAELPSYSTVIGNGWPINYTQPHTHMLFEHHPSFCHHSAPFYHPPPPPTYSESEFFQVSYPPNVFGPAPWTRHSQLVQCAGCGLVGMSDIKRVCCRKTHYTCLALFICGCWPCCVIPYFLSTCKITQHYCSGCNRLLGIHDPWIFSTNLGS